MRQKNLTLAAPAQAKKSQFMPGYPKMKSLSDKFFDFFHLAILKILRFAAIPANQVMMVLAVIIRKLITSPFRDMVYFSQHPHPAEHLYSSID
jgi:hypothetical protein